MCESIKLLLRWLLDSVAEAAKKQREAGLIQITEAAAKAGLGPTIYIPAVMIRGAKLADVLQAIWW